LRRHQESAEDLERIQRTNAQVVAAMVEYGSSEPPRGCSSHLGHAPNVERHRESHGQCLMEDYFIEHPVFDNVDFRRRYRMRKVVFNRIMVDLCNYNDFRRENPTTLEKWDSCPNKK
jgi:hypothetical protein